MAGPAIVPIADALLASTLSAGERLVAKATGTGLAFALDQLGEIDIPDPLAARIDKAQLRALATLYLAADLEAAGILPAVETLARLGSTGALKVELGSAAPLVTDWWRHRHERLSAAERNAFFSRLFGTASGPVAADVERNFQFEDRMLELCEALYKLDEIPNGDPYGGSLPQTRVRRAAQALADNLTQAGGSITAFMASEVIAALRQAFSIVSNRDLRAAFAARDVWGVVSSIARMANRPFERPTPYVRRGKAGMTIISWLAEVSDTFGDASGPLVMIGHPVVGSAIDWIEAALSIGEASDGQPAQGAPPHQAAPPASPWSALGS